jgi:rfaE bifunctional protein kinase chain/domain
MNAAGASANKIVPLDALTGIVAALKTQDKSVVLSLGIFDIIHPGVIRHLEEAAAMGHTLVVAVIRDRDVRRGPGRPVFPEELRVQNVASLSMVDYVCLVPDQSPFECVSVIQPDIFAKGQAYKDRDQEIHKKIFQEEQGLYFGKSRIMETSGFSFSASKIINDFLDIYPEDTQRYLRRFSSTHSFAALRQLLDAANNLNVLVLGDVILDEYHYTSTLGKSGKTNLVVHKYLQHEVFSGGAAAVANHVSRLCGQVTLVSLLGAEDSREDYITASLAPSVNSRFFHRPDGPTVVKKRYIHQYNNQKIFEINYLNEDPIAGVLETNIIDYLRRELPCHDLVLVCDFGHGFITPAIIRAVQEKSRLLAVNAQTNAANIGFNLITKYTSPSFICLDEGEARLAAQDKSGDILAVARRLLGQTSAEKLIVTLGKQGAMGVDNLGGSHVTPIFSSKVIDTVGAGDAFFSYTAPLFALGAPLETIVFVGNAVGAIAVQIMGNKRSVEKFELLEFLHTLTSHKKHCGCFPNEK